MLTVFGVAVLTFMMMMYALEARGRNFILAFALGCALSSVYGFLSATWPFGAVEAIWTIVALRHWHDTAVARVETGRTDTHKGAHSTRHGRTAAAGEAAHLSVNKVDSEGPQLLATHSTFRTVAQGVRNFDPKGGTNSLEPADGNFQARRSHFGPPPPALADP